MGSKSLSPSTVPFHTLCEGTKLNRSISLLYITMHHMSEREASPERNREGIRSEREASILSTLRAFTLIGAPNHSEENTLPTRFGSPAETDMLKRVAGRWAVYKLMERGRNGNIFKGYDVLSNETVAIKTSRRLDTPGFQNEQDIYKRIWSFTPVIGIPQIRHFGLHDGKHVIVMTHHGPSVKRHFERMGERFTLKTILLLGIHALDRIKGLHRVGIVHCDIKLDNLLVGLGPRTDLHLIDFGCSRPYLNILNRHISDERRNGKPIGTMPFSSISCHRGTTLSRRDDLQSLVYVLVYMFSGTLPWAKASGDNENELREAVRKFKECISIAELTAGMPAQLYSFCHSVFELGFEHEPDYELLRFFLISALSSIGETDDGVFDWDQPP